MSLQNKLASIKILWLQPDTLTLWGIPYNMRSDVGQQPYDLWKARRDYKELPPGWHGSERIKLDDWIYLGGPGWWGSLSKEDQTTIQAFLAQHKEDLPQHPCEWVQLVE